MPVKWTPEKDQMLLLKILETHDFKVDTNRVSTAWPEKLGDAPTPRAIQERLARIRADARKSGAMPASAIKASVSAPRGPATPRRNGAKSAPVTPAARANGVPTAPATDLKRKRDFVKPEPIDLENGFGEYGDDVGGLLHAQSIEAVDLTDGVDFLAAGRMPSKPLGDLSLHAADAEDEDDESPTKKARVRRSTSRADISYAESDREDASDGSDYHVDFEEPEELV